MNKSIDLKYLEKKLNLKFNNFSLLQTAFIHRSYLNEHKSLNLKSNERLEFLGDAVLELVTSVFLFKKFPQKPEGELTALRSSLVKTETLAEVAKDLQLGSYLSLSSGEHSTGGRNNISLMANTLEALVGAIYLDFGYDAISAFTNKYLHPKLDYILKHNLHKDYKSSLQEISQSRSLPTPIYQTLSSTGPDHNKAFTVQVIIDRKKISIGTGSSKQRAQQQAAKKALKMLK